MRDLENREKGREEGLIEGREEGLIEGREEGLIKGRRDALFFALKVLLEQNPALTPQQGAEKLGLSKEELELFQMQENQRSEE